METPIRDRGGAYGFVGKSCSICIHSGVQTLHGKVAPSDSRLRRGGALNIKHTCRDFVRDEYFLFDNYEFKSQSLTDCSIKDRLKSNVQFLGKNWCS